MNEELKEEIDNILNGIRHPNGIEIGNKRKFHYRTYSNHHSLHGRFINLGLTPKVVKNKHWIVMSVEDQGEKLIVIFGFIGIHGLIIRKNNKDNWIYKKHFFTGKLRKIPQI